MYFELVLNKKFFIFPIFILIIKILLRLLHNSLWFHYVEISSNRFLILLNLDVFKKRASILIQNKWCLVEISSWFGSFYQRRINSFFLILRRSFNWILIWLPTFLKWTLLFFSFLLLLRNLEAFKVIFWLILNFQLLYFFMFDSIFLNFSRFSIFQFLNQKTLCHQLFHFLSFLLSF
jgi:hypothetical protein